MEGCSVGDDVALQFLKDMAARARLRIWSSLSVRRRGRNQCERAEGAASMGMFLNEGEGQGSRTQGLRGADKT